MALHLTIDDERYGVIWHRVQDCIRRTDPVAMTAVLKEFNLLSFEVVGDNLSAAIELLQFWIPNYPFGCFRQYKSNYEAKTMTGIVNAWLFGVYQHYFSCLTIGNFEAVLQIDVDWLDVSYVTLDQVVAERAAHDGKMENYVGTVGSTKRSIEVKDIERNYNELLAILGRFFIPRGKASYHYLFQSGLTTARPKWRRADHWRCDPLFRQAVLTVLLMVRFRRLEFNVHRDLVDLLVAHLFDLHCLALPVADEDVD